MTQQAPSPAFRSPKPRAATVRASNASAQHAIMEFKQHVLAALSKLADRDTQQIAIDELDKVVDGLSPDYVPVCLSCLYDSEMQQKSVVKKHCVRLFGSLASAYGDVMKPHLPKVVGSILRWLRDPDGNVREACVDTMGILSSRLISASASSASSPSLLPSSASLTLAALSKPLLDALGEQNKSLQTGAAMCLARVIECAKDPPVGTMSQLCSRICKIMSNVNFIARPALLSVVGSLSQIGALGKGQLMMVMPCLHEALENNDWATRKAAAETLALMSVHSGHVLASFRQQTLGKLESSRFDKVKPVRYSILDAIELWKGLPESESDPTGTVSSLEGCDLTVTQEEQASQNLSPTASEKSLGQVNGTKTGKTTTDIKSRKPSKTSSYKLTSNLKKNMPSITDKKVNHDFFKNLSARNNDDWNLEVAVPCKTPAQSVKSPVVADNILSTGRVGEQVFPKKEHAMEVQFCPGRELCEQSNGISVLRDQRRQNFGMTNGGTSDVPFIEESLDEQDEKACILSTNSSNKNERHEIENSNEATTLQSLQRQLCNLERQQSSLLQFVKDFIASSQDTLFTLQERVHLLEKIVGDITGSSYFNAGWNSNGRAPHEINGVKALNDSSTKPDVGSLWFDRNSVSEHANGMASMIQESVSTGSADPGSVDWKEFSHGNSLGSSESHSFSNEQHRQLRCKSGGSDQGRVGGDELCTDKIATRGAWDSASQIGMERHSEGPSARSVWQASKDEATLAAIRVVGEESEASEVDDYPSEKGRLGFERWFETNGVQNKGQWSLWVSILEFVLSGDMESAYGEAISMQDEMLLLRLMSQTGPVLDQLTSRTANELLHTVSQLLPRQKYHEICFGWIQQVVGMVMSDEMEGIEITDSTKKELLLSLQESLSTIMLGGDPSALSTSLEQLFQLLVDAWSVNN